MILVNGHLTREKLEQLIKRFASRNKKESKATLADVWPKEKEEDKDEETEP